LDEGAKDSIIKEDASKLIENAIIDRKQQDEKLKTLEKISPKKYGLDRLDTTYLDELTQNALSKRPTLKR
jgi:hypothetical protein